MKTILNVMVIAAVLALGVEAHATDVPAYRAHATATGINPTVQIEAQAGDLIVVLGMYNGYTNASQLPAMFSYSDGASGTYSDPYCSARWRQATITVPGAKKHDPPITTDYFARWHMKMRDSLVASTGTLNISVDTSGRVGTVAALAISGLTAISSAPPYDGCGTLNPVLATIRQVKANPYCANCGGVNPIQANEYPTVPKSGQSNAYLSTSLVIAVAMNNETSPSPTPPSGWTQRLTVGTTANSYDFGMTVSTLDAGFSGSTITWSSTTPTDGNAAAIEIQAIQ